MMTDPSNEQERLLQDLSALTDGEGEPAQLLGACDVWRRDARVRASWHTYALIGDVMRSDDLASPAAHDSQFLQSLRARLADEPVVLAPAAPIQMPAPVNMQALQQVAAVGGAMGRVGRVGRVSALRRRWVTPAAVAAGFVVVTGATVVMRTSTPEQGGQGFAQNTAPQDRAPQLQPFDMETPLVRNAEIDRYLNAHRQYTLGSSLAGPGGVRQVAETPGR